MNLIKFAASSFAKMAAKVVGAMKGFVHKMVPDPQLNAELVNHQNKLLAHYSRPIRDVFRGPTPARRTRVPGPIRPAGLKLARMANEHRVGICVSR